MCLYFPIKTGGAHFVGMLILTISTFGFQIKKTITVDKVILAVFLELDLNGLIYYICEIQCTKEKN